MTDHASQSKNRLLPWVLALLSLAWLLPGVLGRDPWKADESYTFGLVLHILETGDHLVPTLAGEPFVQKPPLLFNTSAFCIKALTPWMSWENASRMAVLIFLVFALWALGLAGREICGPGKGWYAPVLFMGTIGQFHTSHMLITDVALVSGFAVTLYGIILAMRAPILGGIMTGTGMGMTFMAKGLLGPGVLGLTMILLPVCFKAWRVRGYFISWAVGALVSLPWVIIWPWMLYAHSKDRFNEWFWDNNLGRFLGASSLGLDNKIGMIDERYIAFADFPWYAFPATLVAVWAFWKKGREALGAPGVQLSLLNCFIMLGVVTASRNGHSLYILPVLPAAALLGCWGVDLVTPSFARVVKGFCLVVFGLGFAGAWLGWIAQMTGQPAPLWNYIHQSLPELTPHFQVWAFIGALLFTVLWVVWMVRLRPSEGSQATLMWTAGITGVYLFVMTLWLPAMESRMSYAHLASIKNVLPADHGCVASLNLGEPQRGMFDYYAGLKTHRLEIERQKKEVTVETPEGPRTRHIWYYPSLECQWLLIERELFTEKDPKPPEGSGPWKEVWRSVHSGKELFRLFKKETP